MPSLYRIGGCHSVNIHCSIGVKSLFVKQRDVQPLSVSPCRRFRRCLTNSAVMQQTIIFESHAQERRSIDVLATIRRSVKSLNKWLDGKSEFYSRICEFSVTRRIVLRVNLITLCCLICAVAVENNPLVSITAMLCAGYLVYRLNKQEKGGEA